MEVRQLFDKESSTYTYLLTDGTSGEAALIDPVIGQLERDLKLVEELGLALKYAFDTHVHADHISALGELRARAGCETAMSAKGGADCADLKLTDGQVLQLGAAKIHVLETPGHTNGCLSYRIEGAVFTGDALLIRGCGRTDFQEGSSEALYDSVTRKLFTLAEETRVYPAHDYRGFSFSTIGEERRLNPRLTKSKGEFVELMRNLNLPEPKMIQAAVPANLRCGDKASSGA